MAGRGLVAAARGDGGVPAADSAFDAADAHQSGDLVPAAGDPGAAGGFPQLVLAVDAPVLDPQPVQLVGRVGLLDLDRGGAEPAGRVGVVGGRGDRDAVLAEHLDDRLHPERPGVGSDVVDHDPDRHLPTTRRGVPLSPRRKNPALLSRILRIRRSISGVVLGFG